MHHCHVGRGNSSANVACIIKIKFFNEEFLECVFDSFHSLRKMTEDRARGGDALQYVTLLHFPICSEKGPRGELNSFRAWNNMILGRAAIFMNYE